MRCKLTNGQFTSPDDSRPAWRDNQVKNVNEVPARERCNLEQPAPVPTNIRRTAFVLVIGLIVGFPLGLGSTKLFPDARDRRIAQLESERDQAVCERDAWKDRYAALPPGLNDLKPNEIVMLLKASLTWQVVATGLKRVSDGCYQEVLTESGRAEQELREQCDDGQDDNDDSDPDVDTENGALPLTPPPAQPLKLTTPTGLEAIPLIHS